MTPEYYSDLYRRFSVYARDWSGNRLRAHRRRARAARTCTGSTCWRSASSKGVQGISLHYYTLGNTWQDKLPATGFPESGWYAVLRDALKIDQLLIDAEKIMDKHDPERPRGLVRRRMGHLVHARSRARTPRSSISRTRFATPWSPAPPSTSSIATPSA